jgi:hypothetical protein
MLMAGASSSSPNESTPPNHSSSWKGSGRSERTTILGRNRRTSGLCPARRAISRTVSEAITEMLASSKMPCFNCIICTGAPNRRPTSVANSPEDRHLFSIRRANMRRKVRLSTVFTVRSKQEQVGKLACCQPRETAAVANPHSPECQTSVTIEAVPAQVGDLESFAAHGLHFAAGGIAAGRSEAGGSSKNCSVVLKARLSFGAEVSGLDSGP